MTSFWNQIKLLKNNRIAKNFTMLLMSDASVSIVTILTMLITINTIGTSNNGIIIVIQTYVSLLVSIFSFSSFNGLITFLPKYIKKNDTIMINNYIKQSILLETFAGICAFIVGQLILNKFAEIMGWNYATILLIRLYLFTTIINIVNLCTGLMRIYDKFKYITYINISVALIRLILYISVLLINPTLNNFVFVEIIIDLFNKILYIILGMKVMKTEKLLSNFSSKIKWDKGFVKFSFFTNFTQTVDIPVFYLATFLVNKYLGFSDITILKVAEKIGNIVSKLGNPLYQILYPEISRLVSENKIKESVKFSRKIALLIWSVGILILLMVLASYTLWLEYLVPNYNFYVVIIIILYLVFVIIGHSTQTIHAYFFAFKLVKYNLYIVIIVNLLYIVGLYYFIFKFGLIGVMLMRIIQALSIIGVKVVILRVKRLLVY